MTRFLLHNLLPALVAGAATWAAIQAGIHLLGIRRGKYRLCLLFAPLLKSTLVLLGVAAVLPWPREIFQSWHQQAVPARSVLPLFLLLSAAVLALRALLVERTRKMALEKAMVPAGETLRLVAALDRVMAGCGISGSAVGAWCDGKPTLERPRLLVTDGAHHSPFIVTQGEPTIVFPRRLVAALEDNELDGALGHELAHLSLRQPLGCFSSEWVRALVAVNPLAGLMASQMRREEEKACDDMAVAITGHPDIYAGMLLKSYRFAAAGRWPLAGRLQFVPQLLGVGVRPMLSERVERLLEDPEERSAPKLESLCFVLLWMGVVAVFFQG